ncbi:hypothetical protein [Streptomyces sp. 2R]|uniref:hypothetical protein n=1 Tax=Streptomyces sp. 2R TaxID=1883452 RepID=UPI000B917EE8|nr:hypothetical protein [Streptomyces sp. 2R]OXY83845.1 hypothetical protein BEH93_27415 [Streptomyces sp. 2R]
MAKIDIPQHLIDLESTAWAEQQVGDLTVESAAAVQQAITERAATDGKVSRCELEMAVKKAVRHPEG